MQPARPGEQVCLCLSLFGLFLSLALLSQSCMVSCAGRLHRAAWQSVAWNLFCVSTILLLLSTPTTTTTSTSSTTTATILILDDPNAEQ